MKRSLYILVLAQLNFAFGATVTDINNVVTYKCPIKKIEYDSSGAKKGCNGILTCYKHIPVKATYMYGEDEIVVDADICFYVDQGMTVCGNTIHLNNARLHLDEAKNDNIVKLDVNGAIELPYAEVVFADEDRAQQFKQDVDIQCSGKTLNILKKLDSHRCKRFFALGCMSAYVIALGFAVYHLP